MSVSLDIRGLDQLTANLRKLGDVARRDVAQKALGEGGEIVAVAGSARAPKRRGKLATSIEWAPTEDKGVPAVRVGPSARTQASRKEGFYGLFLERGTGPRKTKAGANRGRLPAHPFMGPALKATEREVIETVRRSLASELDKVSV